MQTGMRVKIAEVVFWKGLEAIGTPAESASDSVEVDESRIDK
jgi:hypothetical protein